MVWGFRFRVYGLPVNGPSAKTPTMNASPIASLSPTPYTLHSRSRSRSRSHSLPHSHALTSTLLLTPSHFSSTESCTARHSSRFKNNCFTVMRSSSEEGSYVRLVDFCITQL